MLDKPNDKKNVLSQASLFSLPQSRLYRITKNDETTETITTSTHATYFDQRDRRSLDNPRPSSLLYHMALDSIMVLKTAQQQERRSDLHSAHMRKSVGRSNTQHYQRTSPLL
ncbi:hypothetical protein Bbelb_155800 [Branchiostoma belcheri]|nr:hypothetical protein Bbelb_155800 [Branchiostoma belcheri]